MEFGDIVERRKQVHLEIDGPINESRNPWSSGNRVVPESPRIEIAVFGNRDGRREIIDLEIDGLPEIQWARNPVGAGNR